MMKKRSSRSGSRGRNTARTRSRSRSRSLGRTAKPRSTTRGSHSHSTSKKTARPSTSSHTSASLKKKEVQQEQLGKPGRTVLTTPSVVATEAIGISERTSTMSARESGVQTQIETVRTTDRTAQTTISRHQSSAITLNPNLAVRHVQNDLTPASKMTAAHNEKQPWVWWFADHAVLILFVAISIYILSVIFERSVLGDK